MIIQAKKFKRRSDLEGYIKAELGYDVKANREAGHEISGKAIELQVLQLSDTCTVYGIKCVVTDFSTKVKLFGKPKK